MKIIKASAGSGKTYTLAHTYIDMLLSSADRFAYRHILAVTFTNKATAEMKSRILRDLDSLSKTDPRARAYLVDILHDYSAFSVSTIDKFFQKTLKVFSREIGQFSAYQLELDRNSLITEAVDRILDNLTEDDITLVGWIKESVRDKIENGERFSFEQSLYDIARRLKNQEMGRILDSPGIDVAAAFGRPRLNSIRKACDAVIKDFALKAKAVGIEAHPGQKVKRPSETALKKDADLSILFGRPYTLYCTALAIRSSLYGLGLAGEFFKEFDALLSEKNLMCLEESNTILRDIIDGSDAPFVYEKTGVRYDRFLLDEFQDTSDIQWGNFLPLLRESESKSGPDANLIVGDVKQSIYRWRGSDWNLLNSGVCREFPGSEPEPLKCNWRSCKAIVDFNNGFFPYAASVLGASDIYADVEQEVKVKNEDQEGYVRISFTDDELDAVLASVRQARECGAGWGDIAVLVRNHSQGGDVASFLSKAGVPVISDDSLRVKSSVTVSRLAALLASCDNPDDSISSFLASSLRVEWPAGCLSLLDLCEELLRQIRSADEPLFDGETLYIQAFMDDVKSWTEANGNNIGQFVRHWNDSDPFICSPDNASSVRIITIHKSKGLEFPYLIFPFADKVECYKGETLWCSLDLSKAFSDDRFPDGTSLFPVALHSDALNTLFAPDYERERQLQAVDNLNLFYVALTRASKCLHVIAKSPSQTFVARARKDKAVFSNLSQILFRYLNCNYETTFGQMYDFRRMAREDKSGEEELCGSYVSIPLGGRLRPSEDALDFFGPDGVTGPAASPRLDGIILHGILSEVSCAQDLDAALRSAVRDGALSAEEGRRAGELLCRRIAAHPQWFAGADADNELTIIGDDGECHRPDRVVRDEDGGVTIIDYKFGERRRNHLTQVGGYMDLYCKMGFEPVRGAVWYVREDEVVRMQRTGAAKSVLLNVPE